MNGIQDFLESCEKMKEVHLKKNADYAPESRKLQNFDVAEYIVSLFKNPRDQVFAGIIGIKLGRLANLLNKEFENPKATPNNESVEDTFIDQANYTLLWKAKRREGK